MAKNENDRAISMYFSMKAKEMHKKNPRPVEFYQEMGKKSAEARKNKTVDKSTCDKLD